MQQSMRVYMKQEKKKRTHRTFWIDAGPIHRRSIDQKQIRRMYRTKGTMKSIVREKLIGRMWMNNTFFYLRLWDDDDNLVIVDEEYDNKNKEEDDDIPTEPQPKLIEAMEMVRRLHLLATIRQPQLYSLIAQLESHLTQLFIDSKGVKQTTIDDFFS